MLELAAVRLRCGGRHRAALLPVEEVRHLFKFFEVQEHLGVGADGALLALDSAGLAVIGKVIRLEGAPRAEAAVSVLVPEHALGAVLAIAVLIRREGLHD